MVGDHDTAGAKGAEKHGKLLRQVAGEVRVLPPLGGEPGSGYDLSDFASDRLRALKSLKTSEAEANLQQRALATSWAAER